MIHLQKGYLYGMGDSHGKVLLAQITAGQTGTHTQRTGAYIKDMTRHCVIIVQLSNNMIINTFIMALKLHDAFMIATSTVSIALLLVLLVLHCY